ncbi:MAG: hypothetical protein GY803_31815 [Chloroflexi bacterium]|nr:hypothetical protein [Chloroflexota bacterium]
MNRHTILVMTMACLALIAGCLLLPGDGAQAYPEEPGAALATVAATAIPPAPTEMRMPTAVMSSNTSAGRPSGTTTIVQWAPLIAVVLLLVICVYVGLYIALLPDPRRRDLDGN